MQNTKTGSINFVVMARELSPFTVSRITIRHILDEDPDLSYLGRYSNSDGLKSSDEIAIDRENDKQSGEYQFFIAANVSNEKEARENYERMESYNSGAWNCIGIKAEATILLPSTETLQHISSGGLWGIESDSDDHEEIEDEQLEDLKRQLKALGIKYPKGIGIERID